MLCSLQSLCMSSPRDSLEVWVDWYKSPPESTADVVFPCFHQDIIKTRKSSFFFPPSSSFVFFSDGCGIIKVSHQNRGRVAAANQCSDIFRSSAELKFSLKEKKITLHIPERGSRHSVGARKHVVGSSRVSLLLVCRKNFHHATALPADATH